jgi:hypothetical protein
LDQQLAKSFLTRKYYDTDTLFQNLKIGTQCVHVACQSNLLMRALITNLTKPFLGRENFLGSAQVFLGEGGRTPPSVYVLRKDLPKSRLAEIRFLTLDIYRKFYFISKLMQRCVTFDNDNQQK